MQMHTPKVRLFGIVKMSYPACRTEKLLFFLFLFAIKYSLFAQCAGARRGQIDWADASNEIDLIQ